MSAALSETEAEMLTRGREPVATSSRKEQKQLFNKCLVCKTRSATAALKTEHVTVTTHRDIQKPLSSFSCAYRLSHLRQRLQKNFSQGE